MYSVAYTKNDVKDLSTRPVSFLYNGGPGSASIWLHMGAFGPKRVVMTEKGESLPPPYKMMDNDATWLDATAQAELVRRGEVSPRELVEAAITRIEAVNPRLDAVIRTRFGQAEAPHLILQLPDAETNTPGTRPVTGDERSRAESWFPPP